MDKYDSIIQIIRIGEHGSIVGLSEQGNIYDLEVVNKWFEFTEEEKKADNDRYESEKNQSDYWVVGPRTGEQRQIGWKWVKRVIIEDKADES